MPSDIHEAANTTKEGWIAWFCPLKLYRHYSGCRIWSGLLYRNYIKLYVSFCAARPGFVAYLFVVQYTTAVLYRCFYIRFVLPLIFSFYLRTVHRQNNISAHQNFTQLIFWKTTHYKHPPLYTQKLFTQITTNIIFDPAVGRCRKTLFCGTLRWQYPRACCVLGNIH